MMMNVQFGDCSGSRDLCHTQTIYETVDMEWMKALTTTFYGKVNSSKLFFRVLQHFETIYIE